MLELKGREGLSPSVVSFAVSHVIRDGKRWGRYPLDLQKDLRRIKTLLKRSGGRGIITTPQEVATPASVSGWIGQKETDLVAFYGNDFLEVVALMEYWSLWQYSNELAQITVK